MTKVEYLGHFIYKEGVSIDLSKIEGIFNWLVPTSIKQLRGFLSLAEYYRQFIRGFGCLAKPLTELLKKDVFVWTNATTNSFQQLKQAMTQALVLASPSFDKKFVLEVDASGSGIRVVLMQECHLINFISRVLSTQQEALSTYEKNYSQ